MATRHSSRIKAKTLARPDLDILTKEFIKTLKPREHPQKTIQSIYEVFKEYDIEHLTLDVITAIYTKIVDEFYNGLDKYLSNSNKQPIIKITDTGDLCEQSLLEAKAYDNTDSEFHTFDYGLDIPLVCLNKLDNSKFYYSGGYITKSRVIFVILMLLHEIIHFIEYTDSYLTESKSEHTVFFYQIGFKVFGLLSRLSEIIDDPRVLKFESVKRIRLIKSLNTKSLIEDGAKLLNDHSHYLNEGNHLIDLGYITYGSMSTIIETTKGGKRNKTQRRRLQSSRHKRR